MDVTLYPDEDWTVDSVIAADVCAITLRSPAGDEVRIEAPYSTLTTLGIAWKRELSVTANGRNPDALLDLARAKAEYKKATEQTVAPSFPDPPEGTDIAGGSPRPGGIAAANQSTILDKIDEKIDNLEALLTDHRKGEERRYPDDFQPGDWVQFPPSHAWRQIEKVTEAELHTNRVINYRYGGILYPHEVRAVTRYPYCTAARFAEVCDR